MNRPAKISRPVNGARKTQANTASLLSARFSGRLICVPSMFDSLGVQVPYPT